MKYSLLIPLILCLGLTVSCSGIEDYIGGEYGASSPATQQPDPDTLSQNLYEDVYNILSSYQTKLDYPYEVTTEAVDDVLRRIQDNNPDFFWLNGYSIAVNTYSQTRKDSSIDFGVLNDYTESELRHMHEELCKVADDIIAQVPDNSDDYGKILFIHDYLTSHCEYSTEGAESTMNGLWGTAYGCLIDGSAVCQGYSEAFLMLMNKLGIESGICSGKSTRGGHAWNYVKVNGKYYWIDVTWDDPKTAAESELPCHDYFLVNDELIQRSRIINGEQLFVPECSSMDDNYFVRNNSYLNTYDIELIRAAISFQGTGKANYELMFSDYDTYQDALERLFTNGEIWDAGDLLAVDDNVNYSINDSLFTISIRNS